jgi:hypothetical protein
MVSDSAQFSLIPLLKGQLDNINLCDSVIDEIEDTISHLQSISSKA